MYTVVNIFAMNQEDTMLPDREFLAVCEVMAFLGVSRAYVCKLLRDGRLEGYKVGRVWIVKKESLLAYKPRRRGRPSRLSREG